ncbi:MAG: hypothetical protein KF780_08840 [Sphingomonas sp.]|nr:hypothetical protein [Sphingomonas sp.]
MKNVTISLDDETHRRARIRAAELGTSLSALVRELLVAEAERNEEGLSEADVRARLKELRKQVPAGFRAADRLSRDEVHDRRH